MTAGSLDSGLSGRGIKHQCQVVSIVSGLAFHFFQKEFQFQEHFCQYFYSPSSFIVLSLWVIQGLQAAKYDMYISMKCNRI